MSEKDIIKKIVLAAKKIFTSINFVKVLKVSEEKEILKQWCRELETLVNP